MARRLFALYVITVVGPALAVWAAWTVRDRLARWRHTPPSQGNGHAEAEALEDTVQEVATT